MQRPGGPLKIHGSFVAGGSTDYAPAATGITAYLTPKIHAALKAWIEVIQTRVAFTSDMLGSMRSVKMLGLTDLVQSLVQDLRVKEVVKVKVLLRLRSNRIVLGSMSFSNVVPLC